MNEFTKEELEQLYNCAKFVTEYNWLHDRYDGLMKKLQCMIDNYCEHRKSFECPECGIYKCEKCERATNIIVKGN